MELWFYTWLRLKNARAGNAPKFTYNPDGRNDALEYLITLMHRGPKGRNTEALVDYLERCCEALKEVSANLDDPSLKATCYFIGLEDALQMLLCSLKKR